MEEIWNTSQPKKITYTQTSSFPITQKKPKKTTLDNWQTLLLMYEKHPP